jgi:Icc protein
MRPSRYRYLLLMTSDPVSSDPVALSIEGGVRLLQISDTHLGAADGDALLGINTDQSLQAVLSLAASDGRSADLMLVTGDIAADGDLEAYQRLEHYLESFTAEEGLPAFWLPGNHDSPDVSTRYPMRFVRAIEAGAWHIVMLYSQQPGKVGGFLSDEEIAILNSAVARANRESRHLLVALHHPVQLIGCDWLDEQRVANAEQLLSAVADCNNAVAVVSGHVHQATDQVFDGVRLLTAPSTCVQFAPNEVEFKVDQVGPGYRWLELLPDGKVLTDICRVDARLFPANTERQGYQ